MDPELKKKLREQLLDQRFEKEQATLLQGNGYELIFPAISDQNLNEKYETQLKKANDIWDEFTTGNRGKNRRDSKMEVPDSKKLNKAKAGRQCDDV